jgi:hypothetical protein
MYSFEADLKPLSKSKASKSTSSGWRSGNRKQDRAEGAAKNLGGHIEQVQVYYPIEVDAKP